VESGSHDGFAAHGVTHQMDGGRGGGRREVVFGEEGRNVGRHAVHARERREGKRGEGYGEEERLGAE
jgi:hypothetical protein